MLMSEVWLRSNRRVLLFAMAPVAILAVVGWILLGGEWTASAGDWTGVGCLAVAGILAFGLLKQLTQPRIAYRDGHVQFYLKTGRPIEVPVGVVEAFFQGEDFAHLPGEATHKAKSVNLIARLSQRETDWHRRDVKAALGRWEEGYVTVRGTWCEPINGDVIRRLNRRLSEIMRAEQDKGDATA